MVGACEGEKFFRQDRKSGAADDDRHPDAFPDHIDESFRDLRVADGARGVAVVEVPEGDADIVGFEGDDLVAKQRLRLAAGQEVELIDMVAGVGERGGDDGEPEGVDRERFPADVGRYEENPLHGPVFVFAKDRFRRGLYR